jgi:hypothetical protein
VPNRVYQNYVPAIAAEIAQWDADTCEAVNEAVTDKQIVITMDTETVDNRYSAKVGKSIEVLMQQDKICYEYPYSDGVPREGPLSHAQANNVFLPFGRSPRACSQ